MIGSHTYLRRRAEYRAIYHLPPDPMETEPEGERTVQQQQREEFIITACEGDHVRVWLRIAETDTIAGSPHSQEGKKKNRKKKGVSKQQQSPNKVRLPRGIQRVVQPSPNAASPLSSSFSDSVN